MKSEFNRSGTEFRPTTEFQQPRDPDAINFAEIAPPADEFAPCAPEFPGWDSPEDTSDNSDAHPQDAQTKKRQKHNLQVHKQLVRQMSYLVVCVVTTAVVSNTLTGNSLVETIQALGGSTRGDLRFSIQWNTDEYNPNDFDAHCIEPDQYTISYSNAGLVSPSGGTLDIDIINPVENTVAVENIIYPSQTEMADGVYKLRVHCYSYNGGTGGFLAEVAIRGRIYTFRYTESLSQGEYVDVANVTVKNGKITLERLIDP